jgi:outer membrane receptor protein involved in Fe transport
LSFGGRFDFWENRNALSSTRTLSNNLTNTIAFPDRAENAFSPRVAALYRIDRNFAFVASYAKSFRAPTLNELYRAFRVGNVLTLANENLRSERAETFETGLNFTGFSRKFSLRGNFFVAEVSRPVVSITLTSAPNLITRQRQNVGKTRSRGIELDAEYAPFAKLKFSASYLLTDSRVVDFPANPLLVGKFLPQVARNQLTFQSVYRPTAKLTFSVQGRISDAQFEDDLNTLRLRPYSTFDAFASYKLKRFEIFTAIENIFDSRYDIGLTPNRTVAAPRFVRVGLRFDLNNK